MNAQEAYQLYLKCGVREGTPLSEGEFAEFWTSISDADREYWLKRFHDGSTSLTRELWLKLTEIAEDPDGYVMPPDLESQVMERARAALSDLNVP